MTPPSESSPTPARRILGIDPGLRICGFAVVEVQGKAEEKPIGEPKIQEHSRLRVVEAGVIRVPEKQPIASRLCYLKTSVDEIIQDLQPTEMAIERLFAHYQRSQPAILMGHARGVILLAAGQENLPIKGYPATTVKKMVTGHGRASKSQMQLAICQHLGLKEPPEPHDVADALSIAMCHYFLTYTPLGQAATLPES